MHNRFKKVLATHCFSDFFTSKRGVKMNSSLSSYEHDLKSYLLNTLGQDLSDKGDITSKIIVGTSRKAQAKIIAKSNGILAGMAELQFFLTLLPQYGLGKIFLQKAIKDGTKIKKGDILAFLKGRAIDILTVERTALNFLQRMSGVATLMRHFVEKVPPYVLITPTRKTPLGLLDKRACLVGGGGTHRLNLSDAVLIKDTHLHLLHKNFDKIFDVLAKEKPAGRFIEIEVESFHDALYAAALYHKYIKRISLPFYLMLDNMKSSDIKKIVDELKKRKWYDHILLEASGGITLENVQQYAKSGVDVISVGAITHSAPALDISLKVI